jgi:hypothetical protein
MLLIFILSLQDHPFSPAFGIARTRKEMIDGAQKVFHGLLKRQNGGAAKREAVNFETIAQVCVHKGGLRESEVKDLIR